MSEPRDAVVEHVAAFNAHDSARVLAGLASDAIWITGKDTAVGRPALAELFDDWLWSLDPHLDLVRIIANGAEAATELRESITVDGAPREYSIAAFSPLPTG